MKHLKKNKIKNILFVFLLSLAYSSAWCAEENIQEIEPVVDVSNSELETSPDVSKHLRLQVLILSNNNLKQAPDVSNNTELVIFALDNNNLTVPPDVSNNTKLTCLALSDNNLTVLPDVSKNTRLEWLSLSNNNLEQSLDIRSNIELNGLDLSNNNLTVSPDISKNTRLEMLGLSNNNLTVPPDVSNNDELKMLHLFNNKFVDKSIDLGHLKNLEQLWIEEEKLTDDYRKTLIVVSDENIMNGKISVDYFPNGVAYHFMSWRSDQTLLITPSYLKEILDDESLKEFELLEAPEEEVEGEEN